MDSNEIQYLFYLIKIIKAIAAVGQGRLMSKYDTLFSNFNQPIAQVLLSRSDLTEVNINNKFIYIFFFFGLLMYFIIYYFK